MPSKVAPPKSTGGGGFVFEDKVCAYFMACMLTDEPPLDVTLGLLERMDFQTRPDGWFLDDVLLTLVLRQERHRCALSIKSNTQFGDDTAPVDFVSTAWEQFLGIGSRVFDEHRDYLGLVTSPLRQDVRATLDALQQKAIVNDPVLLAGRTDVVGWTNDRERALFRSFHCPQGLRDSHEGTGDGDTGRLLARLRFPQFDFDAVISASENAAIVRCRTVLVSGDYDEARALWDTLLTIASTYRPRAGYMTRPRLLDLLRSTYPLKDRPVQGPDWARLLTTSRNAMDQVSDAIGGRVRLDRTVDVIAIEEAVVKVQGVALLGPSGVGKSVAAKRWATRRAETGEKVLWFEARSFERADFAAFEADLHLGHSLADLLVEVGDANAWVVLNGLDRLYAAPAFAQVGALVRLLDLGREGCPWRVVVPCEVQEWSRVRRNLMRVGVRADGLRPVPIAAPAIEDLMPVRDAFPTISRLLLQDHLRPLLVKPKVLDLIASRVGHGGEVDTASWVGESSVAEWFWEEEVGRRSGNPDGRMRARLARLLAEKQADAVSSSIPEDAFQVSDVQPLDSLLADRICRVADERITFEHDLYGDWARLRLLVSKDDVRSYLKDEGRLSSPLWHRAIRLYGMHLLERGPDLARWRAAFDAFNGEGLDVAQDLLLESIVFAATPDPFLERMAPDLLRNEGTLLRRLLNRFLHFATTPNDRLVAFVRESGGDEAYAATEHRIPIPLYWPPMLRFLHAHRAEAVDAAPTEVARVVRLWLDHTPTAWPLRCEMAVIGIMLGERGLDASKNYRHPNHNNRRQLYLTALAGARDLSDAVSDFALRASMRRGIAPHDSTMDDPIMLPRTLMADPRFDPDEPPPMPWPDGPSAQVDDEFCAAVIAEHGLNALIKVRPEVAREVALAVLIEERHRYAWHDDWLYEHRLDIDSTHFRHPTLYNDGPFLYFLEAHFGQGLELIARLVEFATDRWAQYLDERRARAAAEGGDADDAGPTGQDTWLTEAARRHYRPPGRAMLLLDQGERKLLGDERVYGWSAGLGTCPEAVEAALMALEQYFYRRIEAGASIEDEARMVLSRARSVALLKVLCDVGRRVPELFVGALYPLLASAEVHHWDIDARVKGRNHLMIGAILKGDWFVRMARAFHYLKHRDADLRVLARVVLFSQPSLHPFFERARRGWQRRVDREDDEEMREFIKQLVVYLNPENEIVEQQGEQIFLVNARAQELDDERADARREAEDRMLALVFAVRCRELLDAGTPLPTDEIEPFWRQLQRVHDLGQRAQEPDATTSQDPNQIAAAICGGIAVLVRHHADWLWEHEERVRWCKDQLIATIHTPPLHRGPRVPEDVSTLSWECFAAEVVPTLWALDPDNLAMRDLVARLVLTYQYRAVGILFARCAERRTDLGDGFVRLRRLLFEWAHLRRRAIVAIQRHGFAQHPDPEFDERVHQAVVGWMAVRVDDFIHRRVPATVPSWHEMDVREVLVGIESDPPTWYDHRYPIDIGLIQAAHAWLPTIDQARDDAERGDWIDFWRQAVTHALQRTEPLPEGRERHGGLFPHDYERWVLYGAASAVAHMEPDEHPETLWRPIIDVPREAHDWVETFLQALHRQALRQDAPPDGYAWTIRAIVREAEAARDGTGEGGVWRRDGDHWLALLGLDSYTVESWREDHAPIVAELDDLYARWARDSLRRERCMKAFAHFLARPAARSIVTKGLIWVQNVMDATHTEILNDAEVRDAVASSLIAIWSICEARVRADRDAFAAFRVILHALVERQTPLALELQRAIGGL